MKHILVASFVLFSLISSQSKSEDWMYWGWGAGSCADLLKEIQSNDGKLGFVDDIALSSWIQGYITGMNVESGRKIDKNTDIDGIVFELIKRCKAEPMSEISDEIDWIYKNKLVLSR